MAQHILQNSPVLEVVELVKRVDPADQRYALEASVSRDDLSHEALSRLEISMQASDRNLLAALEPERLPRSAFLEHHRHNAHADPHGARDALERLPHPGPPPHA